MKKLLTLLLLATFFIGCSKDDDNGNEPHTPNINPEVPEVPATESLKGQTFSGFFSKSYHSDFDMYRVYTFTSDKEFVEYVTKNSADGDTIAEYKGSYAYTYPDLQLRINDIAREHKATMNEARNEFHYPKSKNETLIFKKK